MRHDAIPWPEQSHVCLSDDSHATGTSYRGLGSFELHDLAQQGSHRGVFEITRTLIARRALVLADRRYLITLLLTMMNGLRTKLPSGLRIIMGVQQRFLLGKWVF